MLLTGPGWVRVVSTFTNTILRTNEIEIAEIKAKLRNLYPPLFKPYSHTIAESKAKGRCQKFQMTIIELNNELASSSLRVSGHIETSKCIGHRQDAMSLVVCGWNQMPLTD